MGKKFYNITLNNNYLYKTRDRGDDPSENKNANIYRVKGCPQQTIKPDGTKYFIVDTKFYRDIYALGKVGYDFNAPLEEDGKSICKSFETLKKTLWGDSTRISAHTMQRRFRPSQVYHHYQHGSKFENGFVQRQAEILQKKMTITLP